MEYVINILFMLTLLFLAFNIIIYAKSRSIRKALDSVKKGGVLYILEDDPENFYVELLNDRIVSNLKDKDLVIFVVHTKKASQNEQSL